MIIERGKGGKDPETLFKYAVQTNEIKVWRIVEKSSTKVPEEEFGFFFAAECKSEFYWSTMVKLNLVVNN